MKLTRLFRSSRSRGVYDVSMKTESMFDQHPDTRISKEQKKPWIKLRYVAVLIGFVADFFYYAQRITMSIGMVAMVNSSALSNDDTNGASDSCLDFLKNSSNEALFATDNYEYTDGELLWSPELQGYVLGISFLCFTIALIPAGWLTELYGCKKIIFWSFMLSSIFTCLTPFAAWYSVYAAIVVQSLRGLVQAGIFPAECALVANWCTKAERGFALAFVFSGSILGAVFGSYISGLLCASTFLGGWPSAFYLVGGMGIVISLYIRFFMYDNPTIHPTISKAEYLYITNNQENALTEKRPQTPWRSLFTSVPVYALGLGYFGQMWAASHFLTVHPIFLKTILHYTVAQNGLLSALPFLTQFIIALTVCWFSKRLVEKNYITVSKSRKFWNLLSCVGYSGCLLGVYYAGCHRLLSVIFGILSSTCVGFGFAGCWMVPVEMSPTFAASLESICSTIGCLSYFILPLIVGYLTDEQQTMEQWNKVIFMSLGVVMLSGIVFTVFGSSELQPWNDAQEKDLDGKDSKQIPDTGKEMHS